MFRKVAKKRALNPNPKKKDPVHQQKRKHVTALCKNTIAKVKENTAELKSKLEPQPSQEPDNFVPSFTDDIVKVLRSGDKKEILKEYDNIMAQIAEDLALKTGSGNKTYTPKMLTHLFMRYRDLNNALFRNKNRLQSNAETPIAELSEDEDEVDVRLHPQPGTPPRKAANDKWKVSHELQSIQRLGVSAAIKICLTCAECYEEKFG